MSSVPARSALPSLRPGPGETLDSVAGLRFLQRAGGYRFNLDPVLLAHFAAGRGPGPRAPTLELGTGCGIIALLLARRAGWTGLTALELQPGLAALARRNVRLNRAQRRVTVVEADLRDARTRLPAGTFGTVICNPPYHPAQAGRISPQEERAIARHELTATLEDVLAAAGHALCHRGKLFLIYPAARTAELLAGLAKRQLRATALRPVHTRADRPAEWVLLEALKDGRGALALLPALVVQDAQGDTPEVRRLLAPMTAAAGW